LHPLHEVNRTDFLATNGHHLGRSFGNDLAPSSRYGGSLELNSTLAKHLERVHGGTFIKLSNCGVEAGQSQAD
jgi:hypothetical protein